MDYVTHEARYSLSEEKLIRQQVNTYNVTWYQSLKSRVLSQLYILACAAYYVRLGSVLQIISI